MHRNQSRGHKLSALRIQIDQIHQGEIATELFITADSFVIREKIPAAIKNQATFENLDRFHVMRRVAVNESKTFFDQAMGERDLLRRNVITPVAAPVDRSNEQIVWLLKLPHRIRNPACGRFRKIIEQVYPRTSARRAPSFENAARRRSKREEKQAPFARYSK